MNRCRASILFCLAAWLLLDNGAARAGTPEEDIRYLGLMQPLPDELASELVRESKRVAPSHEKLWFILVFESFSQGRSCQINAMAYYQPDSVTGRVQRGSFAWLVRVKEIPWQKDIEWTADRGTYIHVLPKGQTSDPQRVPDPLEYPIRYQTGTEDSALGDDALVQAVDVLRDYLRMRPDEGPIYTIEPRGQQGMTVRTGLRSGRRAMVGAYLELEFNAGQWRITRFGHWSA